MRRLQNILAGMTIMGEVPTRSAPYPGSKNGFAKDRKALRGDEQTVARSFNRQIYRAYGKQEYAAP